MKKALWMVLGLLALIALAFFLLAPGMAERSMNKIDDEELPEISDEAIALHGTLTIVDLHSDTLLWQRSILEPAERGHMDLPRLQAGNVALQVLSSVTKTPKGQNYDSNSADGDNITGLVIGQMQPVRTWSSLLERSLYHGQKLDEAVGDSDGGLNKVIAASDLDGLPANRAGTSATPVLAMLSIEGLHNLEGDADNLQPLYDAGFRMAGLTHFFDNELAGSMHGEVKGGLTLLGREVVQRMESMGMIVDIAHLSNAGVAEVLAMASRPVVSSHGGVQATCPVNRNLSDEEITALAATGGVVGIGYWEGAVCDTSPASIARAMKHVRDLVGIEHVALGSDYDGATTVRFDTAGLVHVTQALMDAGFTAEEIRAVMGENALRVIRAGIQPAADISDAELIMDDAAEITE